MEPNKYVYRFGELTLKDFEEFTKIYFSQEALKKSFDEQRLNYNRMIEETFDRLHSWNIVVDNMDDYFIKEIKNGE